MEKFLTIGEVSKLFKTTNRQLRFYEEIGLLNPARVDETNGYRYYSQENCKVLKKILCLKDMGLSLSDISIYFTGNIETKKKILQKYLNLGNQMKYTATQIFKDNDFDLRFVEDISYVGNAIHNKNLSTLCGVWLLSGAYKGIKDARENKNSIEGISPYRFLAFDEFGNSPWFYFADNQFITFDTWKQPSKEIYQVRDDKLYLKINNPTEHIFGQIENPIEEKHVLVFKKTSDKYEDYVNFIYQDKFDELFENDSKLIGCWKLKDAYKLKYLIVSKDGSAVMCLKDGIKHLKWSKGYLFDEELKIKMCYKIQNSKLILENKTRTYIFSNIHGFNEEYLKI